MRRSGNARAGPLGRRAPHARIGTTLRAGGWYSCAQPGPTPASGHCLSGESCASAATGGRQSFASFRPGVAQQLEPRLAQGEEAESRPEQCVGCAKGSRLLASGVISAEAVPSSAAFIKLGADDSGSRLRSGAVRQPAADGVRARRAAGHGRRVEVNPRPASEGTHVRRLAGQCKRGGACANGVPGPPMRPRLGRRRAAGRRAGGQAAGLWTGRPAFSRRPRAAHDGG